MNKDTQAVISFRIEQAETSLESARDEKAAGRLAGAINRAYYSMFYAGLALLAQAGTGTSKHAGLITKVSELFVKTGRLRPDLGRALHRAFELRQKSDYREFFQPDAAQVGEVIGWAEDFLEQTRQILQQQR